MPFEIDIQQIQKLENLELIAKQVVEGFITGLHKSPFHGFSVEFAEHRLYNTGESTKHVDWKLFGRTDKLFVKRYEEETNLRCQLVIDASSSMYFPENSVNKLQFSIYAAAALMNLLKKQRDAFGLSVFSDKLDVHTPAKSSTVHQKLILNELEKLINTPNINKGTSAVKSLHTIAESIHKRSLIILFSDMMESGDIEKIFAALQHLKHRKHEVVIFHTMNKDKELEFNFENRPYQFVDMETGEEIKLHPNEVKYNYIEQINKQKKELELKCGQYGIDFVEVDIENGFHSVLLSYLIKRKKMR